MYSVTNDVVSVISGYTRSANRRQTTPRYPLYFKKRAIFNESEQKAIRLHSFDPRPGIRQEDRAVSGFALSFRSWHKNERNLSPFPLKT